MDYQRYAFELLANSDLRGLNFTCGTSGCPYASSTGSWMVSGYDVLRELNIDEINHGAWGKQHLPLQGRTKLTTAFDLAGILVAISVIYRVA
jgi:hypothetical protein